MEGVDSPQICLQPPTHVTQYIGRLRTFPNKHNLLQNNRRHEDNLVQKKDFLYTLIQLCIENVIDRKGWMFQIKRGRIILFSTFMTNLHLNLSY